MAILIGTSALGTNGTDFEQPGFLIGSQRVAVASGTITQVQVRSSSTTVPAATAGLAVGIFTDSASTPANRIGVASATLGPQTWATATWYTLTGLSAAVTNGTTYWIVFWVSGTGNWQFSLNDSSTAGGTKNGPSGGAQASLPATWPGTNGTFTEIINAYGEDVVVGTPSEPPFINRSTKMRRQKVIV